MKKEGDNDTITTTPTTTPSLNNPLVSITTTTTPSSSSSSSTATSPFPLPPKTAKQPAPPPPTTLNFFPPSLLLTTLTSTISFTSTLALSTYTQLKLLKISTGTIFPVPTILGVLSVGLASIVSHGVSVVTLDCIINTRDGGGGGGGGIVGKDDDWREVMEQCRNAFFGGDGGDGGGGGGGGEGRSFWKRIGSGGGNRSSISPSWEEMKRRYSIFSGEWNKGDVAHALRVCTLGLVAFKLLGGRFWAISPSSYTNIGSFARASIPATSNYATASERSTIERLGRISGCHTCGSRMIFTTRGAFNSAARFHGDHMPPQAVTKQMNNRWFRKILGWKVKQRFYPQCVPCSNKQGSILAKATNDLRKKEAERRGIKKVLGGVGLPNLADAGGGTMAHFHGLRFRTSHLAGGVIAATTVGGNVSGEDLRNGNRNRYLSIQEEIEEKFLIALTWIDDRFKRG